MPSVEQVLARTVTHALVGLETRRVEVEAHLENGVPGFAIVGLGGPRVSGGEAARPERDRLGRAGVADPADHGQPRAGGAAEGGLCASTCRSRSRSWPRRVRFRGTRSRSTRPSASWLWTGDCGRSAECSALAEAAPRGRVAADALRRALVARGRSGRDRAGSRATSRRGGRVPAGRARSEPWVPRNGHQ